MKLPEGVQHRATRIVQGLSKKEKLKLFTSWPTNKSGRVWLMYDASLHARPLQLPIFSTFEVVAAFVHRAGFNAAVVVLYRSGSCSVTNERTFLDVRDWRCVCRNCPDSSYKHISNLSYVSKLIEQVVARHFNTHTSESHLLPDQQSAYRPLHSTETARGSSQRFRTCYRQC
jgi:hypothetical protein